MENNNSFTVSEKVLFNTARSSLINICLIALLITGYLVLPMYIMRIIKTGWQPVTINHIVILLIGTFIIVLRNRFSLLVRTITLIGISISSSYFGLFSFGIVGSAFFGMGLFGCIVAALVIGKRAGFILLTVSTILFIFYTNYVFSKNGLHIIRFLTSYVQSKTAWYNALSGFILPIFMLIMGIGEMHKIIKKYIATIDIKNKELDMQNRFRAALFNTTDSFVIITDSKGLISDINKACETATGYSLNDVINKSFIDTFLFENKALDFTTLFNENNKKRYEIKWINKYGNPHLINFTLNPIRFDQGTISHWFISGIDMTEYRELEGKFIQSQKMESIGKLAGGVAHDFNNFLTGIIGSTEMLKFSLDEENLNKNQEYIDIILNAGNKASSLVKKLLNFSRVESGPTELFDIEIAINDTVALLKRSIKNTITINTSIDSKVPLIIKGENAQLVNALLNLGINSRDAMEKNGGSITYSAKKVFLSSNTFPEDNISDGYYVQLDVTDTGSGIPKHLYNKVFDPFFTTKEQGKGTGLGLSSVYGTVKRHKGIIKLYSEIDIGTKFSLFLPLSESQPNNKKIMKSIISNMTQWKILLVDDEEIIRKNTSNLLKDFSHTVTTAQNGIEALSHLEKNIFNLVILDWIMPQMNGAQTLEQIKQLYPNMKVIVSSGFGTNSGLLKNASEHKEIFFLAKPYTPEELLSLISEIQNTL
ncbi:MAG: hypothetical protein A2015_07375 [Spirochaetes bacterium GWF1_31_7]|nr:MAG: hypothetical protein A2Y30_02750 [Spirochaetes bacterium GWE1_32_154]OHD51238.1 MAG: hypothetical protein A2015_07375 [Spirochaetes bacterium GWF1_31_7]HBD96134.1 hypothetical protein [Spirochaetia bacterium]HBI37406.1 hypothetical protein [Spirochaetia bacterium]